MHDPLSAEFPDLGLLNPVVTVWVMSFAALEPMADRLIPHIVDPVGDDGAFVRMGVLLNGARHARAGHVPS